METKSETVLLMRCRCGSPHAIVAKIKPGLYIVACDSCPTHARGETEKKAREAWNVEVQR